MLVGNRVNFAREGLAEMLLRHAQGGPSRSLRRSFGAGGPQPSVRPEPARRPGGPVRFVRPAAVLPNRDVQSAWVDWDTSSVVTVASALPASLGGGTLLGTSLALNNARWLEVRPDGALALCYAVQGGLVVWFRDGTGWTSYEIPSISVNVGGVPWTAVFSEPALTTDGTDFYVAAQMYYTWGRGSSASSDASIVVARFYESSGGWAHGWADASGAESWASSPSVTCSSTGRVFVTYAAAASGAPVGTTETGIYVRDVQGRTTWQAQAYPSGAPEETAYLPSARWTPPPPRPRPRSPGRWRGRPPRRGTRVSSR